MKIETVLREALNARALAKSATQVAQDSFTIAMDSLQKRYSKSEITGGFYDTEKARLLAELEEKKSAALKPLEQIREDFHKAVDAWALPSGADLDMNTIWILQNMDLTADQYNAMLEANRTNYTMYSAIRAAAESKRAAIAEANAGRPINQQIPFDLAEPIQSPEARKAEFDSFLVGLQASIGDHYTTAIDPQIPSAGSYASVLDKLNATAARFAERIQPMEAGDDPTPDAFPFKVLEDPGEVPKVW